jgi:hypothetical protein
MHNSFIFIGIALAYAILKIFLEQRLARLDAHGDERRLADLAFARQCSVFELFRSAGSQWNFSRAKIDIDFRRFLRQGEIPPYVNDYVRHHLQAGDRTYQRLIFSGGRPPYL